jgi:hypothetical protein
MARHPSAAAESVSCSPRRLTDDAPVTATERAVASRAEGFPGTGVWYPRR